ncbi:DUF7096 domain-containing protein [Haladaptatus salinisoli]|uniref:DUF7096 domain-containing protein n=1 Tax=Haladaptatus salinisoli TaxID=2884876 RepID=UPI001D0B1699|nr:hypothetical protein [Haladaptatus salinisoli]
MSRVLPVALAVLLVLCSPAAAFETGSPNLDSGSGDPKNIVKPPDFNDTASHLSIGKPDRTDTYTPSVDLGAALTMDRAEVRTQKRMYTLNERLANADTQQAKEQVLIRHTAELESRLSSLNYTERTISKRFNSGEITTQQYVRRLAVLDVKARNIARSIEHFDDKGDAVPSFAPPVRRLRANLYSLRGQVRQYAADRFRGRSEPRPIYVATTNTGVVLSTIEGSRYVREAFRADYRKPGEAKALLVQRAANITLSQYPWLNGHEKSPSTDYGAGVYPSIIPYSQGVVKPVLDSGTEKIFRETQYKYLTGTNHIPYGTAVRNNSTTLNLAVNRTYSGGPLRINLTDAGGDPVNGSVSIGETYVGQTGDDGVLWTVSPRQTFTVSTTRNSETVNVTLVPYGVTATNSTTGPPET